MTLILTRREVESLLSMEDAIAVVEEAFRQFALRNLIMPPKVHLSLPQYKGGNVLLSAYIKGESEALGFKHVSVYTDNAGHNLPTTLGTVLLNDPRTGALLAVIDGTYLTAIRTGAVAGVASKYLAKRDARIAGIFGAGAQARTQLEALCAVRPLEMAKVYDVAPAQRDRYAGEMSERLALEVVPVEDPRQVVQGSDIVVTATSSSTAVFDGNWLEPGTHVNCMNRELDAPTVERSKFVVDSREVALLHAGDGPVTADSIYAELGELVTGHKAGRVDDREITLFKSEGLALQDVAVAMRAYQLAQVQHIGTQIDLQG